MVNAANTAAAFDHMDDDVLLELNGRRRTPAHDG